MFRNMNVIANPFNGDAKTAEHIGDDAKVLVTDMLDGDVAASHGCHTNERTYLNHVGKNRVVSAMQFRYALDSQQVRTDARNFRTHSVEHMAELLDVRFTSRIVDGGGALGKYGCHDDVGSTRHTGFVQQHICAFQFVGVNFIYATFHAIVELCT